MAVHSAIEYSPHPSRVVLNCHEHNGSELMLVAPWRKHLTYTFGPNVGSRDLHDVRHAKPPQVANLPCARILIREPPADELVVFSTRSGRQKPQLASNKRPSGNHQCLKLARRSLRRPRRSHRPPAPHRPRSNCHTQLRLRWRRHYQQLFHDTAPTVKFPI